MPTSRLRSSSGTRPWTTFYVETPDITASLAHVEQLGGRVVMPRTVLPGATLGIFEDPEGHAGTAQAFVRVRVGVRI